MTITELPKDYRRILKSHIAKWPGASDQAALYRDLAAIAYRQHKGHWPLVVYQPCYSFMDDDVAIVDCNVFDKDRNAEVTIENGSCTRHATDFEQLSWSYGRILLGFIRETGIINIEDYSGWIK